MDKFHWMYYRERKTAETTRIRLLKKEMFEQTRNNYDPVTGDALDDSVDEYDLNTLHTLVDQLKNQKDALTEEHNDRISVIDGKISDIDELISDSEALK